MKTGIIIIGLALCFLSQKSMGQGNLVLNGGFDISTDHIHADDWTITPLALWNSKNGEPAPDLVLELQSPTVTATASQIINNLTPGLLYIVSGDYYAGDTGSTPPLDISFAVSLGSVTVFQTATPLDLQWHSFTASYQATSTSEALTLTGGLNDTGVYYSIDNIAMEVVPEPSLWPFILMGAVGLICTRRFRWVAA